MRKLRRKAAIARPDCAPVDLSVVCGTMMMMMMMRGVSRVGSTRRENARRMHLDDRDFCASSNVPDCVSSESIPKDSWQSVSRLDRVVTWPHCEIGCGSRAASSEHALGGRVRMSFPLVFLPMLALEGLEGAWGNPAPASSYASETLRDSIKSNAVVIFSSSQCAKSEKTKAYFEDLGVPYYAIALDTRADGAELKKALSHATGSKSVPRVFVNGQV